MRRVTIFTCLLLVSGAAHALSWPWTSCDQRWHDAWKNTPYWRLNRFGRLPSDAKPDCKPTDPYLKLYPGGKKTHDHIKQMKRERREAGRQAIRKFQITGYRYYIDTLGRLHFRVGVKNNDPYGPLTEVDLSCHVVANHSVQLYSGSIEAHPNVVPGSQAYVEAEFQRAVSSPNFLATGESPTRSVGYSSVSTRGQRIESVSIRCQKVGMCIGKPYALHKKGNGCFSTE